MSERLPFAYVQVPSDSTWETYLRLMEEVGDEHPAGLLVHVAEPHGDGGVRIVDVWESEEAYERFRDERLVPAVKRLVGEQAFAQAPPVQLDVLDVRNALLP